ncbi:MAG TPA: YegS/Rv2252/BmrU family lipid kinase [Kofleriaceae bacterium]|nr:YegS/Rv2252/BmrU family lipid kinase [Kofleriaceae bacterium]
MHIAIVWNARAGSATGVAAEEVVQRIVAATAARVTLVEVTDACDPRQCARDALAADVDVVVAAGGDGTVSSVAAALVGTPVRLGVLPLGTSNSFAAALGLPATLDEAIAVLAAGDARAIDVAIVEAAGRRATMILHCMLGIHAEAIESTSTESKQRWGVLAYAASTLRELATLEPFAVELDTGDHVVRCQAIAIAAANLAPTKTVLAHGPSHLLGDDGRVDVTIVAAETMAEAVATGVHLYRSALQGEPATRDNVGSFSAAHVTITATPPQRVLVDGEPFGETPVSITTVPRALTVVAPPPAHAEGPPVEAPLIGLPALEIDGRAVE